MNAILNKKLAKFNTQWLFCQKSGVQTVGKQEQTVQEIKFILAVINNDVKSNVGCNYVWKLNGEN